MLYLKHTVSVNENTTNRDISKLPSAKLIDIWKKAGIPTIQEHKIVEKKLRWNDKLLDKKIILESNLQLNKRKS